MIISHLLGKCLFMSISQLWYTVKISDRFEKFPRALFTYRGKKLIQNFTNNWVHRTIGVYYTAVVSNIVCFNY